MSSMKIGKDYSTDFNPVSYINKFRTLTDGDEESKVIQFTLKCLHEIFGSGIFDVSGMQLLDVGTGPSIHTLISACKKVNHIDISDFAWQNREILRKWKTGNERYQTELVKYVLDLEKTRDTIDERIEYLKSKVRNILKIDVTQENIISDIQSPMYDVVISSFCLESATKTAEEYTKAVYHVANILQSGGKIIITGALNNSYYVVGEYKFYSAYLNRKQVYQIYERAGFVIRMWREYSRDEMEICYTDELSLFVMLAEKV